MEIHSSSLRFIPSTENPRKDNSVQDTSTLDEAAIVKTESASTPSAERAINSETRIVQSLTSDIGKQKNTSTNSLNARAVDLYVKENTQPLQKQRSDLISRIDFFI